MLNPQREYLERKLFKQKKNKTRYYLMGKNIYKIYEDFQQFLKVYAKHNK